MHQLKREDATRKLVTSSLDLDEPAALLFGDWLVRRGLISRAMLFRALNEAYRRRCRVGAAIAALGLLDSDLVEEEARSHGVFRSFA